MYNIYVLEILNRNGTKNIHSDKNIKNTIMPEHFETTK